MSNIAHLEAVMGAPDGAPGLMYLNSFRREGFRLKNKKRIKGQDALLPCLGSISYPVFPGIYPVFDLRKPKPSKARPCSYPVFSGIHPVFSFKKSRSPKA